jgi:hypothetical protein
MRPRPKRCFLTPNLHPVVDSNRRHISALNAVQSKEEYRVVWIARVPSTPNPCRCFNRASAWGDNDILCQLEQDRYAVPTDSAEEIVRATVSAGCANAKVNDVAVVLDYPGCDAIGFKAGIRDEVFCGRYVA